MTEGKESAYQLNQRYRCPVCNSRKARIVWISEDKKAIAVQCPNNHYEGTKKTWGNIQPIIKTNVVTLINVEKNNREE